MASQGQRRPTSRGEIDVMPAARAKLQRTAPQNNAQLENKQENPRTDPGHLTPEGCLVRRLPEGEQQETPSLNFSCNQTTRSYRDQKPCDHDASPRLFLCLLTRGPVSLLPAVLLCEFSWDLPQTVNDGVRSYCFLLLSLL
ncbi:hypothetical protein NDU88_006887 [Pleurodeles waltl]|uniref:Uncharacterized protein n=1 Tax=Pleurodeles waltl TaxID=8319 RepID=A0AAV7WEN8_PLEWA|nr:hypothetical protein NDU88_006887 [Pleurodeles waltl]